MKDIVELILSSSVLAIDTETTGLKYPQDRAFGLGLAVPGFKFYWDIRRQRGEVEEVVDAINRSRATVAAHNVSFDYRMMLACGFRLPLERMDDTVVRAAQINEHLPSYELDALAKRYLGLAKDVTIYRVMADLFGGMATRNVQISRIKDAPPEAVAPYCGGDAEICLKLWMWQEGEIESQGIRAICDFERGLTPEFVNNEVQGIRVDVDEAVRASEVIGAQMGPLQAELNSIFDANVNPDSSPQIKELFSPYEKDGAWYVAERGREFAIGTTPKGGPSLRADFMLAMADAGNRAADLIIQLRSLRKTKDTFLLGHVVGHSHEGRVYHNINQSKSEGKGVGTGRLSYTNPALQQIPSRNKIIARVVKSVFLPDEGHVWVDYDLDGFEVVVFAHLVNHPDLIQAFKDNPNLDVHQYVADVTGLPRNPPRGGAPNGKQLNLSMIFNQGNGATAEKMGLPWSWDQFDTRENGKKVTIRYKKAGPEAMAVINNYHRRVPGVKELIARYKMTAEQYGYVQTRNGRRLRFPNRRKSYKASGLAIQATAADVNKQNWVVVREALEPLGGRLLLNTHDSYGTSVPAEHGIRSQAAVKNAVESSANLRVPVTLSCSGFGANWWEAVKGDD